MYVFNLSRFWHVFGFDIDFLDLSKVAKIRDTWLNFDLVFYLGKVAEVVFLINSSLSLYDNWSN